jgi:hypothetical protein
VQRIEFFYNFTQSTKHILYTKPGASPSILVQALLVMPMFLQLPRELRDLIYTALITSSRPSQHVELALEHTLSFPSIRGGHDHGCYFLNPTPPPTCANFLATNRQINEELGQCIARVRQMGRLVARIDCVGDGKGDRWHFMWCEVPVVRTTTKCETGHCGSWKARILNLCRAVLGANHGKDVEYTGTVTCIETLQIDVRYAYEEGKFRRRESLLRWAVCAALTQVLRVDREKEEQAGSFCSRVVVTIGTLVLNVVKPAREDAACGDADSQVIASDLVHVWNELWAGEWDAVYCRALLKGIERVRVCIDGVCVRERELKLELERGRKEMKRIALRNGR